MDFYHRHNVVFRPDNKEEPIIKEMAGTFYPSDPVKMGLQMTLYVLSVLGAAKHPNCEKAWELLESKKNADGKYVLEYSFSKPYMKVGKIGKPNKWVTLYALLIAKHRS